MLFTAVATFNGVDGARIVAQQFPASPAKTVVEVRITVATFAAVIFSTSRATHCSPYRSMSNALKRPGLPSPSCKACER